MSSVTAGSSVVSQGPCFPKVVGDSLKGSRMTCVKGGSLSCIRVCVCLLTSRHLVNENGIVSPLIKGAGMQMRLCRAYVPPIKGDVQFDPA